MTTRRQLIFFEADIAATTRLPQIVGELARGGRDGTFEEARRRMARAKELAKDLYTRLETHELELATIPLEEREEHEVKEVAT